MANEYNALHEQCDNNYEKYTSGADIKLEDFIVQTGDFIDSKAGVSSIGDDNVTQGVLLVNIKDENLNEQLNGDVSSTENCEKYNSDPDTKLKDFTVLTGDSIDSKAGISLISDNNVLQGALLENIKDESLNKQLNRDIRSIQNYEKYYSDTDIKLEDFIVQIGDSIDSKAGISLVNDDNVARGALLENIKPKSLNEQLSEDVDRSEICELDLEKDEEVEVCTKNKNKPTLPQDSLSEANRTRVKVKRNKRRKLKPKVILCKECNRTFAFKYYSIHIRIHEGNTPYKCNICQKAFVKESRLKEHQVSHSESAPYSCKICGKRFKRNSDCTRHQRTHSSNKFITCDRCDKSFQCELKLRSHKVSHATKKTVSCAQYGTSFEGKTELYQHISSKHLAKKVHTCEYCGRTCPSEGELAQHIRTHTGEKPFTCEICEKSFCQRSGLTRHIKIHSGEKPFTCEVCKKSFCMKERLTNHIKTKHSSEMPLTCKVCKRSCPVPKRHKRGT